MNSRALAVFAFAVATFEGKPGDRNWRNNNPGNLKFAHQRHAVAMDREQFAIFDTLAHGFEACEDQIALAAVRHPDWSIRQFVDDYAPPSDKNDNNANYALSIAQIFGVEPTTKMQDVLNLL